MRVVGAEEVANASGRAARRRSGLHHLYFPTQPGPVVDSDARCQDAALDAAPRAKVYPFARLDVSLYVPFNRYRAGLNVRLNLPIGPDHQLGITEAEFALEFTVDVQIGISRDLSMDLESRVNSR